MISEESLRRRLRIFNVDYKSIQRIQDFPSVRINDALQSEAYKWCQLNFNDEWVWSSPIQTEYTNIYFLRSEDALLFKLRFETLVTT